MKDRGIKLHHLERLMGVFSSRRPKLIEDQNNIQSYHNCLNLNLKCIFFQPAVY